MGAFAFPPPQAGEVDRARPRARRRGPPSTRVPRATSPVKGGRNQSAATHFSRKFLAGISIQSNQYLDVSEQGFSALQISIHWDVKTYADAYGPQASPPARKETFALKLVCLREACASLPRASCPRSDVPAARFSRIFFAGINIQSNQCLDVSEQGFLALRMSVQSDVLEQRAAYTRKKYLLLFAGISSQTRTLENS